MPKISALPPAGSLADDDETPFVDDSVATTKKFTLAGLKAWLQSLTDWVTNSMVAAGFVVQSVYTEYFDVSTHTNSIPLDNTIPQITEGEQIMSQTITPKSATNKLRITVQIFFSNSTTTSINAALFRDSTANAISATEDRVAFASAPQVMTIIQEVTAGSTAATTFKVRIGTASGTLSFNGSAGTRRYGTMPKSTITVQEIKAS